MLGYVVIRSIYPSPCHADNYQGSLEHLPGWIMRIRSIYTLIAPLTSYLRLAVAQKTIPIPGYNGTNPVFFAARSASTMALEDSQMNGTSLSSRVVIPLYHLAILPALPSSHSSLYSSILTTQSRTDPSNRTPAKATPPTRPVSSGTATAGAGAKTAGNTLSAVSSPMNF